MNQAQQQTIENDFDEARRIATHRIDRINEELIELAKAAQIIQRRTQSIASERARLTLIFT